MYLGFKPFIYKWISYCSAHRTYQSSCKTCNYGHIQPYWKIKLEQKIFKISPKLWKWWVNK